ncbi:MAG: ferritin [Deltaproteobacteria bacterium]|nr:ferritin [Deltaproteobacteria bacterium]
MISERIEEAINKQINAELYSAYLYASMAAYFDANALSGFSNWMRIQVQEEISHAVKFYQFLNDRGGRVILTALCAPPTQWPSPLAVFEEVYKHEQDVTRLINGLADLAAEEKDHMSKELLQWFIAEQVEEEASADKIVQDLKRVGDNGHGLLMLDREAARRVFVSATSSKT